VAGLRQRADEAGESLVTMTLDSEVRFANASDRNAFARELSDVVARLIVRYHDAETPDGEPFRVVLSAYPSFSAPDGGA